MKKLLIACLTFFTFSAFSQSYLVLHNGVTLTTDTSGYVYDFNHFILPYKVQIAGGQFLVEDEKLITIDESGFLYRKNIEIKKVKGRGQNYFINDGFLTESNILHTVDSKGFVFKWNKDAPDFKKANKFGGNYFVVTTDEKKKRADLYTINNTGNFTKINIEGLNPFDIAVTNGTFFTANGVLYTVNKEGFVFSKKDILTGPFKKMGGNYFIDSSERIFTVSDDGYVLLPELPVNLKLSEIKFFGPNYFIDSDGRIFVVDRVGSIFERFLPDHDLRNIKVYLK
jgi:hypothetical protein